MEQRLGRGLGSLLGRTTPEQASPTTPSPATLTPAPAPSLPASKIPVDRLEPNPFQPRKDFDAAGLEELVASIQRHGVLQPIVVRPTGNTSAGGASYQIIAGERRWRCAQKAGLASIPAVIRTDLSDDDMLEIALVENVQRRDLNAIERARGYQDMVERLGLTQAQVAERVGLKRATVTNHLRLLELPEKAQHAVAQGLISMGHARAMLGVKREPEQLKLVERIVREGLSVRQIEDWVRVLETGRAPADSSPKKPAETRQAPWQDELARRLRERLGTKVAIHNGDNYRGQIVIDYYSREELDRLIDLLAPPARLS